MTDLKEKAAEDPNELPEEERALYLKQLNPNLVDGTIRQEFIDDGQESESTNTSAMEWANNKVIDAIRFWSQFTNYSIDLDDGTKLKFYRIPATKAQLNEIEDLSAITQAKYEWAKNGKKKFLDPMELLKKQRELETLKINTYLRMMKTNKPPTMNQIGHVANSTDIDGILETCHGISISKWHEGKKE